MTHPSLPFRNVIFTHFAQFRENSAPRIADKHGQRDKQANAIRFNPCHNFEEITKSQIHRLIAFLDSSPKFMHIHATNVQFPPREPEIRHPTWILVQPILPWSRHTHMGASMFDLYASVVCSFDWKRFQNTDQSTRQLHTFVFRPFRGIGAHKHLQA